VNFRWSVGERKCRPPHRKSRGLGTDRTTTPFRPIIRGRSPRTTLWFRHLERSGRAEQNRHERTRSSHIPLCHGPPCGLRFSEVSRLARTARKRLPAPADQASEPGWRTGVLPWVRLDSIGNVARVAPALPGHIPKDRMSLDLWPSRHHRSDWRRGPLGLAALREPSAEFFPGEPLGSATATLA
jgi:hypothetical protein